MNDPIYRAPAPLLDEQLLEMAAALGIDLDDEEENPDLRP